MVDVKKLSECAMHIVTYAGCAKSCYMQALQEAKKGNWKAVEGKLREGERNYGLAHDAHGGILVEEVNSLVPQISLLMAHAEDQIMAAELVHLLVEELLDIYKEKRNHE